MVGQVLVGVICAEQRLVQQLADVHVGRGVEDERAVAVGVTRRASLGLVRCRLTAVGDPTSSARHATDDSPCSSAHSRRRTGVAGRGSDRSPATARRPAPDGRPEHSRHAPAPETDRRRPLPRSLSARPATPRRRRHRRPAPPGEPAAGQAGGPSLSPVRGQAGPGAGVIRERVGQDWPAGAKGYNRRARVRRGALHCTSLLPIASPLDLQPTEGLTMAARWSTGAPMDVGGPSTTGGVRRQGGGR